jgi:hypothetical protein
MGLLESTFLERGKSHGLDMPLVCDAQDDKRETTKGSARIVPADHLSVDSVAFVNNTVASRMGL